jgi:hypothetical protein
MLFAFFFFCLPPSFIGLFSALAFTGFFSAFFDFPAFCSASLGAMLTTKFFLEKLTRSTHKPVSCNKTITEADELQSLSMEMENSGRGAAAILMKNERAD